MSIERAGAVTLKGNSLTLVGPELQAGEKAPDFEVIGTDMNSVTLKDTEGHVRVFSVVPSLDTPVCDSQTRRFNKEAAGLPGVKIYTVSMDLPFAQSRWCAAADVTNVVMLSDHRNAEFGKNYGTLIKELRLHSRAIFVLDQNGKLLHVDYVKEVGDHPNYEPVLEVIRRASSSAESAGKAS